MSVQSLSQAPTVAPFTEKPVYGPDHITNKLANILLHWVPGGKVPESRLLPPGDVAVFMAAFRDQGKLNETFTYYAYTFNQQWEEYLQGWFQKLLQGAEGNFEGTKNDFDVWLKQTTDFAKRAKTTDPQEELARFIGSGLPKHSIQLAVRLFRPTALNTSYLNFTDFVEELSKLPEEYQPRTVTLRNGKGEDIRVHLLALRSVTSLNLKEVDIPEGFCDIFGKLSLQQLTVERREAAHAIDLSGIESSRIESLALLVNKVKPFTGPKSVQSLKIGFDVDSSEVAKSIGTMSCITELEMVTKRAGFKYSQYVDFPPASTTHIGEALDPLKALNHLHMDDYAVLKRMAVSLPERILFEQDGGATNPIAGFVLYPTHTPLEPLGKQFVARYGALDIRENPDHLHKLCCMLSMMYQLGWCDPDNFMPKSVEVMQEWLVCGLGECSAKVEQTVALLGKVWVSANIYEHAGSLPSTVLSQLGKEDPKQFFQKIKDKFEKLEQFDKNFSIFTRWFAVEVLYAMADADVPYSVAAAFTEIFKPVAFYSSILRQKDDALRTVKALQLCPTIIENNYITKRKATEIYLSTLPDCVRGKGEPADSRLINLARFLDVTEVTYDMVKLAEQMAIAILENSEFGMQNLFKTFDALKSHGDFWTKEHLTHLTSNLVIHLAEIGVNDELLLGAMKLLQDTTLMPSNNFFRYDLDSIEKLQTLSGNRLSIILGINQDRYEKGKAW